jgi:2-polyprenyl-6-methoxyphenol hydroxylase-like FAD-dependent oxidoreductase
MDRIVVLGAGVAGMSAARRLAMAGHAPVLVAPFGEAPSRGETLSYKAERFIEALGGAGLLDAATALSGGGRFSIWGSSSLRQAGDENHGFHIDRSRLEQRMAQSLGEAGVERLALMASALEHLPSGVRVNLADGHVIEAPALIDCTGRTAISSGETANRRRLDRLVGAWRVLDLPDDAEAMAATLVEAVELGWWYMASMPGLRMMLGLFTDSDLLPAGASRNGALWAGLAGNTRAIAARLESLGLDTIAGNAPPEIAPAASVTVSRIFEGRILRAGDSAAALDPLGANGLATAFWSGINAADAALALIAGDPVPARAYEQAFLEGITNHLANQKAMYGAEQRFTDAPFWARRNHSSPSSDNQE